jgi:hypothetical protein
VANVFEAAIRCAIQPYLGENPGAVADTCATAVSAKILFAWLVEVCSAVASMREGMVEALGRAYAVQGAAGGDGSSKAAELVREESLLGCIVSCFHHLSSSTQQSIQALLFCLLVCFEFKGLLGRVLVDHYNDLSMTITNRRAKVDLSHMSVQVFTVPSVAEDLVCNMHLLDILISHMTAVFRRARDTNGCVRVDDRGIEQSLYSRPAIDLQYLLRQLRIATHLCRPTPGPDTWHARFRQSGAPHHGEESAWAGFLGLLRHLQGTDASKRERTSHIRFESLGWKKAFHLVYR